MKQLINFLAIAALAFAIASCSDNKDNEDLVSSVNKKGSVETSVAVHAADSLHDVLVTKHTVWNHDTVFKTVEYYDTIPALGEEAKNVEDKIGNEHNVKGKKEYEVFITVK